MEINSDFSENIFSVNCSIIIHRINKRIYQNIRERMTLKILGTGVFNKDTVSNSASVQNLRDFETETAVFVRFLIIDDIVAPIENGEKPENFRHVTNKKNRTSNIEVKDLNRFALSQEYERSNLNEVDLTLERSYELMAVELNLDTDSLKYEASGDALHGKYRLYQAFTPHADADALVDFEKSHDVRLEGFGGYFFSLDFSTKRENSGHYLMYKDDLETPHSLAADGETRNVKRLEISNDYDFHISNRPGQISTSSIQSYTLVDAVSKGSEDVSTDERVSAEVYKVNDSMYVPGPKPSEQFRLSPFDEPSIIPNPIRKSHYNMGYDQIMSFRNQLEKYFSRASSELVEKSVDDLKWHSKNLSEINEHQDSSIRMVESQSKERNHNRAIFMNQNIHNQSKLDADQKNFNPSISVNVDGEVLDLKFSSSSREVVELLSRNQQDLRKELEKLGVQDFDLSFYNGDSGARDEGVVWDTEVDFDEIALSETDQYSNVMAMDSGIDKRI